MTVVGAEARVDLLQRLLGRGPHVPTLDGREPGLQCG
jgi:hypothetical protein